MIKSLGFSLFVFCLALCPFRLMANPRGPSGEWSDGFHKILAALSHPVNNDDLWDILETEIDEETLQLQLARIAVISQGSNSKQQERAVLHLGARQDAGHPLLEQVQQALIDAVRLKNTPNKVKFAIFRNIKFSIANKEKRLEILNWALSHESAIDFQDYPAIEAVSSAIERFPSPSPDVRSKLLELAGSRSAPKKLKISALKKLCHSSEPDNQDMHLAITDIALSDRILQKDKEAVQILSHAISIFQTPSSAVMLKLSELVVSTKAVHKPFRQPALDVLEINAAYLDRETQKKLLSGLVDKIFTGETTETVVGIFHQIPQIDPEVKKIVMKELFSNLESPTRRRPHLSGNRRRTNHEPARKRPTYYTRTPPLILQQD